MELLHLRVLREVARCGSISAAAEALDYTQPAVSRQLAMLERQAGQDLVERTPRGAHLTSAGQALLRHANAILERVDEAQQEMEDIASLRGGSLRFAAFPTTVSSFVPKALRSFRDQHPDVKVQFELVEAFPSAELMRAGQLDVAVTNFGVSDEPTPGYVATPLIDDPLFCALSVDHPLADYDVIPLEALSGETWAMGSSQSCPDREIICSACELHGFAPDNRFVADDYQAILGLVASGLAVGAVPALALQSPRTDVVIKPFANRLYRRIIALVADTQRQSPVRAAMVKALVLAANEYSESAAFLEAIKLDQAVAPA